MLEAGDHSTSFKGRDTHRSLKSWLKEMINFSQMERWDITDMINDHTATRHSLDVWLLDAELKSWNTYKGRCLSTSDYGKMISNCARLGDT